MAALVSFDDVEVGTEIPAVTFPIHRSSMVMYAGASGDFNIIHWNERIATMVGLPDVIAHGMLTMATAGRVVTDWVGDPGALVAYGVRFSKPVVVPDTDEGTSLVVSGEVTDKNETARTVTVSLTARSSDDKVLSGARVVVRLA